MRRREFPSVIADARAGESSAFARLFAEFQPILLRYLRTDRTCEVDDIASDTWIAVVRGLDTFTGDMAEFTAWILTIARHRRIDAARARQRRRDIPVEGEWLHDASTALDVADEAIEREGTRAALSLIAELPPDQGECLYLRFVAGLDIKTVAGLMERSEGAVRILSHRGLRALQARMSTATTPV